VHSPKLKRNSKPSQKEFIQVLNLTHLWVVKSYNNQIPLNNLLLKAQQPKISTFKTARSKAARVHNLMPKNELD